MKALAAFLLLALLPVTAGASPFFDPYSTGMVFVGPTSAHPSSTYWNPAATGLLRGYHFYLSGFFRNDLYQVDRASIDPATGEPGGSRRFDEATGSLRLPGGSFAFSGDFGSDKVTIGVAFVMPYGDDQPDDVDAFRYHTLGGSMYSYQGTLSFSYRPLWNVILGFGANLLFTRNTLHFSLDQALETCADPPCDVENPATTSDFDMAVGDDFDFANFYENPNDNWYQFGNPFSNVSPNFAFNVGAMWKPFSGLWLGATYHSRPDFGPLSSSGGVTVTNPDGSKATGAATLVYRLPQMIQAGARYDLAPGVWQLAAALRWVELSALDHYDLRMAGPELREAGVREWVIRHVGLEDSYQVDLALETPPGPPRRFGFRLHGELGGVSHDAIAPGQIGGPELAVSAGISQAVGAGFALTLAATAGWVFAGEVDDSVYRPEEQTTCVKSGYDLDECEAARRGSSINSAAGTYARQNLAVMLGVTLDLL